VSERGFTLIELVATLGVLALMLAVVAPNFGQVMGQLKASEDIRNLALNLSAIRSEAVRLKAETRVTFTSSGYSWDFFANGVSDGAAAFNAHTGWQGSVPASITFNGHGLLRGVASDLVLQVVNRGSTSTLSVNRNGFVSM
jgi:prepilin-type N-terminal cleavage/methylation domain-containing protein